MADRKPYRRRERTQVTAIQLALDTEGFVYRKWGNTQRCKPGDWLVESDGEVYTVDREVFARTYRQRQPGRYEKIARVWAERAEQSGSIHTLEGHTDYGPGDYLVFNDPEGRDGWAMDAGCFRRLYESTEPSSAEAVCSEEEL